MAIEFNGQKVIRSYKIRQLSLFYEMLKPTYSHHHGWQENLNLVHQWADWLQNVKKLPFVMLEKKYEKDITKITLLVFGEEKKHVKD